VPAGHGGWRQTEGEKVKKKFDKIFKVIELVGGSYRKSNEIRKTLRSVGEGIWPWGKVEKRWKTAG